MNMIKCHRRLAEDPAFGPNFWVLYQDPIVSIPTSISLQYGLISTFAIGGMSQS